MGEVVVVVIKRFQALEGPSLSSRSIWMPLILLNSSSVGPIGAVEGFALDNCAESLGSCKPPIPT